MTSASRSTGSRARRNWTATFFFPGSPMVVCAAAALCSKGEVPAPTTPATAPALTPCKKRRRDEPVPSRDSPGRFFSIILSLWLAIILSYSGFVILFIRTKDLTLRAQRRINKQKRFGHYEYHVVYGQIWDH